MAEWKDLVGKTILKIEDTPESILVYMEDGSLFQIGTDYSYIEVTQRLPQELSFGEWTDKVKVMLRPSVDIGGDLFDYFLELYRGGKSIYEARDLCTVKIKNSCNHEYTIEVTERRFCGSRVAQCTRCSKCGDTAYIF